MTQTLRTIDAFFPADNILAQLCDEQKFFKQHLANFSNIIPYGELFPSCWVIALLSKKRWLLKIAFCETALQ